MTPAYVVQITTPKKVVLDGLWLGPKKPHRVIIWLHGLGSTMFRKLEIAKLLVDDRTAILSFNNRGHDKVAVSRTTTGRSFKSGSVHEVFTECVDDIEGAIRFARTRGVEEIYLIGHSTGCQKVVYWAGKRGKAVRGIVLLSPISDFSAESMSQGAAKVRRAAKVAKEYVRTGRSQELLPERVWGWPWIADAQRFLSLYTGSGPEETFTYWDPARKPGALGSIKIPTLVMFGDKEEYAERPVKDIAMWFERNLKNKHKVVIVPKVGHGFKGAEKRVAREIAKFMKES